MSPKFRESIDDGARLHLPVFLSHTFPSLQSPSILHFRNTKKCNNNPTVIATNTNIEM